MPKLPKVAIVGLPNVGKSALFNKICMKRIAIVDEAEGITRDRIYGDSELFGKPFEIIDTGGIHAKSTAEFNDEILKQAQIAIEEADSLIMVVDSRVGMTDLDSEVARILLRTKKPVCLAVNKIDTQKHEERIHEFHGLGIENIIGVSAIQNYHIAELLHAALDGFAWECEEESDGSLKVAIIGRPNVGKSTLVNGLLKEERCCVSSIAGTTRDSIDIPLEWEKERYTLVDTAGIRRKHAEHEVVDKFAAIRTQRAIERSDICILMIDAQEGITSQEKRIASSIEKAGKGCIIALNKWDLVKGFRMEHCLKSIRDEITFLNYCPAIFISAKTGRNHDTLFEAIQKVKPNLTKRISTGELNNFIEKAIQNYHPPYILGKRLRIY